MSIRAYLHSHRPFDWRAAPGVLRRSRLPAGVLCRLFASCLMIALWSGRAQSLTTIHNFTPYAAPNALVQGPSSLKDTTLYGTTQYGGAYGAGMVFSSTIDGKTFTVLHNFQGADGSGPTAGLLLGADNMLYGTTAGGGAHNIGTVFQISRDGKTFNLLHSFKGTDGANPATALFQAKDGFLYGTTPGGGAHGKGEIYQISTDGTTFKLIHSFIGTDGGNPVGGMTQGPTSYLYGAATTGGPYGQGVIYQIAPDGSNFVMLHYFKGTDGAAPSSALILAGDQLLYGTTQSGGTTNDGTVFHVSMDGRTFKSLYAFQGSSGAFPTAPLVMNTKTGSLYGTTPGIGTSGGTLYEIFPGSTSISVLHVFSGYPYDGSTPTASPCFGQDGNFYGSTQSGGGSNGGLLYSISADGKTYKSIFNFGIFDGEDPLSALVQGKDGLFYGTTSDGGPDAYGIVFKVSSDGKTYNILHTFTGADGYSPVGALVQGNDGMFYGTTEFGGANDDGVVFQISTDGTTFNIIHTFSGADGQFPTAAMIVGNGGLLYGTTYIGGANADGEVFQISTDGTTFNIVHSFGGADGAGLGTPVLLGTDGLLYGATFQGGTKADGVVYQVSTNGKTFNVLHNFTGADGANVTALIQGQDGFLYGNTENGGSSNHGTVFQLSTDGVTFKTLHTFNGTAGANPTGLIQAKNGTLYGTIPGDSTNNGEIFKLATTGKSFASLFKFLGADGANPAAVLIQGKDGLLYGTTQDGGTNGLGTVFSLAAK